jgi:transcriptional regulator with PAS, ATPase and Fis domain
MAKILEFRRVKQEKKAQQEPVLKRDHLEEDVQAIMNDYSLTPANRRWILENMLMEIDEQLEAYKKELEQAERRLERVVKSAEHEIVAAYSEFEVHVKDMTKAVDRLTRTRRTTMTDASAIPAGNA